MALPVTVYRWDDAGAPSIVGGNRSSVLNVLKKCLVDGYGDKLPLGWTIEAETIGESIAFVPSIPESNGGVARIYSSSSGNNAAMYVYCGNVNLGGGSFSNAGWIRTFQTATNETGWILIGTARGFYFQYHKPNTNNNDVEVAGGMSVCIFVGEIDSFFEPDPSAMTCISANSSAHDYSVSNLDSIGMIDDGWSANRFYDLDNNGGFADYNIAIGLDRADGTDWQKNTGTYESTGVPIIIQDVIIKGSGNPHADDNYGVSQANSLTRPYIRGKLPGLYRMNCALYSDQPWPTILNIAGVNYYAVPSKFGVTTLIKLDTWYD
ncbi:hypothetical protein C8J23_101158 [Shewanella chilikensis]|uniref:Uncharacterized protein n=2 Tax=Shewanella chilikensis TaxID=558541 RepID=A0ABX5PT92_9GAMM|nr:hypothetical protein C8J23_101158 [Shewanella chilikensis]GGZ31599.1 hypothetical protein GCM10007105_18820 [Shewanella chilikensis]